MNKASARENILRDLWQRNALRRAAQLPLIDIEEEREAALHRLAVNEYYEVRRELEPLRPILVEKWIARRQFKDPSYAPNRNSIWHMMVHHHVNMVLDRILRMRTGRVHPGWRGKMIRYGEAADDADGNDE